MEKTGQVFHIYGGADHSAGILPTVGTITFDDNIFWEPEQVEDIRKILAEFYDLSVKCILTQAEQLEKEGAVKSFQMESGDGLTTMQISEAMVYAFADLMQYRMDSPEDFKAARTALLETGSRELTSGLNELLRLKEEFTTAQKALEKDPDNAALVSRCYTLECDIEQKEEELESIAIQSI